MSAIKELSSSYAELIETTAQQVTAAIMQRWQADTSRSLHDVAVECRPLMEALIRKRASTDLAAKLSSARNRVSHRPLVPRSRTEEDLNKIAAMRILFPKEVESRSVELLRQALERETIRRPPAAAMPPPRSTARAVAKAVSSTIPTQQADDHAVYAAKSFLYALSDGRVSDWVYDEAGLFTVTDHRGNNFSLTAREVSVFYWGAMLPAGAGEDVADWETDQY